MSLTWIVVAVILLGALGGLINSFNSDTGFVLPRVERAPEPATPPAVQSVVWMPGWIGNVVVGAVAALLYWALYGPFANFNLAQQTAATAAAGQQAAAAAGTSVTQTVAGLATSFLVGLGGGRVLTSEVDKRLLKAAASQAASGRADGAASASIAGSTPRAALQIAANIPRG